MARTAAVQARQGELDRFASRRGWARGTFRSWKFHGFAVSIAAKADDGYVAARGSEQEFFRDLGDLERHVAYVAITGHPPG